MIIGILWLIYAFIVFSFTHTTIWAIAIFAGTAFIAAGIVEFVLAAVLDSWQWLHAPAGVLYIAAGIVAFVWRGETFLVLAAIIGWFLLFRGTFNIVESLLVKDYVEQWWLILITTGDPPGGHRAVGSRLRRPVDRGLGRLGRCVGADRGSHEHLGGLPAQERAPAGGYAHAAAGDTTQRPASRAPRRVGDGRRRNPVADGARGIAEGLLPDA